MTVIKQDIFIKLHFHISLHDYIQASVVGPDTCWTNNWSLTLAKQYKVIDH